MHCSPYSDYQKLVKKQVKGVIKQPKEHVPNGLTKLYEEVMAIIKEHHI